MRLSLLLMIGTGLTLAACQKQGMPHSVDAPPAMAPSAPAEEAAAGAVDARPDYSGPDEKGAGADSWRKMATEQDRQRIRNWYRSWQNALTDARAKGDGAKIDAEGVLLNPSAALDNPAIAAGDYRCRTLKLGAKGRATLGFISYDWFRCRIEASGEGRIFSKLSGSQRPSGRIFADGYHREVFLGTLALGDEMTAISYGSDRMRDMAGIVERIGDRRWRIVLPDPAYESLLDVIEMVPLT